MNKEQLFSLMPTEVVKEDEVNKKIEEQRGIIKAGKSYISQLSINRFLRKKLVDFDLDEILSLFDDLRYEDFIINENELYFYGIDIESFACILEESFNLDNMYELDNVYIENLLNGKDITKEEINYIDETKSFAEVLDRFVFKTGRMSAGDTPTLLRMLVVKKALLGTFFAEKNVESLLNGQKEIHNISMLM